MSDSESTSTGNPVLDHPGISATVFALLVIAAFCGALYNNATSHSGGHGNQHHDAAPGHAAPEHGAH